MINLLKLQKYFNVYIYLNKQENVILVEEIIWKHIKISIKLQWISNVHKVYKCYVNINKLLNFIKNKEII